MHQLRNMMTLFLLLLPFSISVFEREFYNILNIDLNPTLDQIEKAYKKLIIKNHPDRGGNNEKFIKLKKAYDTLKDQKQKSIYDKHGEEGLDEYNKNNAHMNAGSGKKNKYSKYSGSSLEDKQKGENVIIDLHVTLEELYISEVREVLVKNQVLCPKCYGLGAKSEDHLHECDKCKGEGYIYRHIQLAPNFVTRARFDCDKCSGKGFIIKETCPFCKGTKIATDKKRLNIYINKGMKDGEKIVFENEGDETPDIKPGDLIFKILTLEHDKFRREGNNLYYETSISLRESLIGFDKNIEHLDKRKVPIKKEGITKPGEIIEIKGEGMPYYSFNKEKFGNLFVKFSVDYPDKLNKKQIERIKEVLI